MDEEFLKGKSQKVGVPIEEMKELWQKFEKEAREMGFPEEELDRHLKFRISKYFLKLEREPIVEGKFQPLSMDKTDFGAMKQYLNAVEAYNNDPESAIKEGMTNNNGVPLYQKGFNKGKPIELEKVYTVAYRGFFIGDKEGKKKYAMFRLGGEAVGAFSFQLGNIYDVKGIKSQKNSTEKEVVMIGRTDYPPKLFKERTHDEVVEDLKSFYEGRVVPINKVGEFYEKSIQNDPNDKYPLAVVKGNILQLSVIGDKEENGVTIERNNRIELMQEDENFEVHTVGGWVPKTPELEFDFSENAQDVYMVGSIRKGQDRDTGEDTYDFSKVMGIFVPKSYRKSEEDTKPVEETEEVTDKDVENFVKENDESF